MFNANSLNELTTLTRNTTNALTVAGNTTGGATNVTVNGLAATLYDDFTFVSTNFTITNGINTFTATANDGYGRTDTTTTSVNLSATNSYIYDLDGNLLSDGIRAFDYDDENQLIRVTVTNAWKSEFTYDGKFRRRIRKEFTRTGSTWSQTNEVRYIYDGNAVLQERDANNLPTVSYTRTGMRLLARTENASLLLGSPSAHAYYHADGNGNVTALISTNQLIVARYLYDPFGNILSESGPLSAVNLCRYSSQEFHVNSGLIYFGRRFYDSSLQRFINRDPIEETGGNNLYTFVVNNPIALVDIMGLCAQNPSLWDLFWSNIYDNWQQNTVDYYRGIGHGAQGLVNMAWNAVTDPVGFTYNAVAGIAQQLGNASVDPSGYAKNVWDGFVNNLTTSEGIGKFVFGLELGLATSGLGSGEAGANVAAATKSGTTLAEDLAGAATRARDAVGPGSGGAYGTRVHTAFEAEVNGLRNPNLLTEQSYLNGDLVRRGTPGSVRLDVVHGPADAPISVFDLKTGSATLTPARIQQIQSHVPGGANVPVFQVRP